MTSQHAKLLLVLFLLLGLTTLAEELPDSPSRYRFSFVGCNRVGFEVNPAVNPATINIQQLKNTFNELAEFENRPSHLFFLGDLILGYTSGLSTVDQLEAWVNFYERSKISDSGIILVPVVGNHEVLLSLQDQEKKWHDYPNPPALRAWQEVMKPYLKWRDGPTTAPPNLDSVTSTQEDMSFTIQDQDILFILLNTDTFVDNITTGDIPLHWLEAKLKAGQADPSVNHIFVMGHKPLIKPDLEAWIIRDEEIQPAIELLGSHSKVRAFLTAHYHFWDYRLLPNGIPQIIAGNGGSLLKGPFAAHGVGYFGYTLVDILESGDIVVESWGRLAPKLYSDTSPQPRATLRERRVIRVHAPK